MIPIRDDAPRSGTPYITYFLLAINTLIFLYSVMLPYPVRADLMRDFGIVPDRVTLYVKQVSQGVSYGQSAAGAFLPFITSMFLHSSWLHLIFNMWALYIFGDNIESHLGHWKYLLFYLIAGLMAGLVHVMFNPASALPTVGASGAIGGVMGAYFLLFPSARVLTAVPLGLYWFIWVPAWLYLAIWFFGQFLSGAATAIASTSQTQTGGVAFWAHVGGFVAGMILVKLFPSAPQRYRYDDWN